LVGKKEEKRSTAYATYYREQKVPFSLVDWLNLGMLITSKCHLKNLLKLTLDSNGILW
jgi:hypothetical protein